MQRDHVLRAFTARIRYLKPLFYRQSGDSASAHAQSTIIRTFKSWELKVVVIINAPADSQ